MDKIGSSYIAVTDLIICSVAIVLFYRLTTLPPNGVIARVLAVLCGCIVVAIIVVILLADNLSSGGVYELSMIGMGLSVGLWKWNHARVKSRPAPVTGPEFSK